METTTSKESDTEGYIVFFDLDHTLVNSVSGTELAKRARKKGLMSFSNLINAIFLSVQYRLGLKDETEAVYQMAGWVKGTSVEEMHSLCSEVFSETLLPAVYPEAREEILRHKLRRARTVILSSTLAPVCRQAASHLGIDDIICSEMESKDGMLTGKPLGRLCFGDEKLVRLKDYCEKNNSKLQDAWYYADAVADLPALSIVGHPVCINPERKLEKIASSRGWKIYYWK